jgi:hypothetical protein
MPRSTRQCLIMCKVETTPGTEAAPAAATDAMLLTGKPDITPLDIKWAERDLLMPWFGGSQALVAEINAKVTFSVELSLSGVAGTAAAWSPLLRACGSAQTPLATPTRIEHVPLTANPDPASLTIYFNDSGVLGKLVGARGSVKISAKKHETPKLLFEFLGAYRPMTAAAIPAATLTMWKPPLVMTASNVTDITLGCTYAAGVLSGGTVFGSTGLELDIGSKYSIFSTLRRSGCEINDRNSTISFELELDAAQQVAAASDIAANVTTGIGFTIGSAAGNKLVLFAPAMQRTAMKLSDQDGTRLIGFDGRLLPVSGNDEWRIVQL